MPCSTRTLRSNNPPRRSRTTATASTQRFDLSRTAARRTPTCKATPTKRIVNATMLSDLSSATSPQDRSMPCSTKTLRSNNPPRRSRTTEAPFVRTAPPHADLQSHTNQTHRQRNDALRPFVCNKSARPVDAVLDKDAALEQSTSEVSNDGSAVRADCSAARRPARPHQPNASSTQRCSQTFRLQQVRKTGRCRARQRRCARTIHLGGLERRKRRSCGLLRRTPTCKATPTKRIVNATMLSDLSSATSPQDRSMPCSTKTLRSNNPPRRSRTTEAPFVRTAPPHADLQSHTNQTHRQRNDAPRPFVCNKSARPVDAVLDKDAALEQSTSEVSNDGSAVRADCSAARRPAKPHQPNASSTQRCSQTFRLQQVRKTGRCRARQRRCARTIHLGGLERRKRRSCGLLRRTPTCKATPTKRIVERNDAPRPFVCNKSARPVDAVLDKDAALEQSTSEVSNDGSAVRADCSAARRPARPHQPNASSSATMLSDLSSATSPQDRSMPCSTKTLRSNNPPRRSRTTEAPFVRTAPPHADLQSHTNQTHRQRNDAPRPFVCNKSARPVDAVLDKDAALEQSTSEVSNDGSAVRADCSAARRPAKPHQPNASSTQRCSQTFRLQQVRKTGRCRARQRRCARTIHLGGLERRKRRSCGLLRRTPTCKATPTKRIVNATMLSDLSSATSPQRPSWKNQTSVCVFCWSPCPSAA